MGLALQPFSRQVITATKFGFKLKDGQSTGTGRRSKNIRAVAEASLKRLKTDYIDLVYQHRVDPTAPIENMPVR